PSTRRSHPTNPVSVSKPRHVTRWKHSSSRLASWTSPTGAWSGSSRSAEPLSRRGDHRVHAEVEGGVHHRGIERRVVGRDIVRELPGLPDPFDERRLGTAEEPEDERRSEERRVGETRSTTR